MGCHRGHQVGDSYDFDTERGKTFARWRCTLPFPMSIFCDTVANCPVSQMEPFLFCCPDVDVINVFQLTVEDEGDGAASV